MSATIIDLVPLHFILESTVSVYGRITNSSTGILTVFAWMQSGHFGILNSEFSETACMPVRWALEAMRLRE